MKDKETRMWERMWELRDLMRKHRSLDSELYRHDGQGYGESFEVVTENVLEFAYQLEREAERRGRKEFLREVELMARFSSRKDIDLSRDEAFGRLIRLLESKLSNN